MGFFPDSILLQILGAIVGIIGVAYLYMRHIVYNYWSSRGIVQDEATVPFGNLLPVLIARMSIGEMLCDGYNRFKSKRVFGIYSFHRPTLVVCDPDLIRFVLTKEFGKFHDRGMYVNEEVDPMSSHLFLLGGIRWRRMRTKLTSTFTSVKMKKYFGAVKDCTDNLARCFANEMEKKSDLVEVKDIMARFTSDVIASIAFGLNSNSLQNENSAFFYWGRKTLEPKPIRNTLLSACPPILRLLNISSTDKGSSDFFFKTFKEMVAYRRSTKVVRNDFMDLIIQLMDRGYVQADDGNDIQGSEDVTGGRITMEEGAAQAFVFFLAGFETSSTTATYCLYEMALNPLIQEKLADEINSVLKQFGGISYESIAKMVYLHKVVSETLRKYPIVPQLNRECNQDVDLPNSGFNVPAGTPIFIPVLGIHMDPDYYPDPEKFDPERFSEENIAKRHRYAYLPFGEGPRNCIGMRFGYLQTKMGLIVLLSKYRFKPTPDLKVPLPLDRGNLLYGPLGKVTLQVEER